MGGICNGHMGGHTAGDSGPGVGGTGGWDTGGGHTVPEDGWIFPCAHCGVRTSWVVPEGTPTCRRCGGTVQT